MAEDTIYAAGNGLVYLGAAIQPNELFKWIQLGLGILLTVIGIAYKIWCWYKKAKADGKITGDEIKELIKENKDEVIGVAEDIIDLVGDIKNSNEDKVDIKGSAIEEAEFRDVGKKFKK